jgi:sulfatase modifying factor 1
MTRVGRSCVDRWEAHLVVRDADGSFTPYPANHRPEKGVSYEARSEPGVYPQAYVNRIESRAACEAAGKRLCSIAEWYRACRGPKGTTYPYGWHELRGKCNSGKAHLLSRMYGRDPRRWDYVKQFNDPALDVEPGFLAKTGEYAECTNERGAFDMVGNVHEWVSDIVDDQLEKKLPLQDDLRGRIPMNWGHGIFMGGFYSTTREHGEGCGFVTFGHEPAYHDYSTGFRCCKDAAP